MNENTTSTSSGDCDSAKWPKGPAFRAVLTFAANEGHWLREYTRAWWIATENGHNKDSLVRLGMMDKRRGRRGRGKKGGKGKGKGKGGRRGGGRKSSNRSQKRTQMKSRNSSRNSRSRSRSNSRSSNRKSRGSRRNRRGRGLEMNDFIQN